MATEKFKKPRLVSLKEAADLLGLSVWTLYEYCAQGRLPSYKLGRRRLMSLDDIEKIIENARQEAKAPEEFRIGGNNMSSRPRGGSKP
jgi:excisionase family DNA binding protein